MNNKREGTEGQAGESLNGDTRTDSGVLEREAPIELARSVNGRTAVGDRLRIIIADPDPLARRVIRDSLRFDGGFIVSAEAKEGREAVELALHYRPELVLMEVGMPGLDGIGACREITAKAPEVRVVMFSVPQDRDVEIRALRAGAGGFLSKNANIEAVVRALRSVAGGEAAVTRSLISDDSSSAMAPMMVNIARPMGLSVSI